MCWDPDTVVGRHRSSCAWLLGTTRRQIACSHCASGYHSALPLGVWFLQLCGCAEQVQAHLAPVALRKEPGLAVKVMSLSCVCSGS